MTGITKVWEVNGRLVVASSIEDAADVFRYEYPTTEITMIRLLRSAEGYDALIRESEEGNHE